MKCRCAESSTRPGTCDYCIGSGRHELQERAVVVVVDVVSPSRPRRRPPVDDRQLSLFQKAV